MGTPITYPWAEGGGSADLGAVLIGGDTGNTPFRVRNVGSDTPFGKYPGGVPPPGGETDKRETP